MVGDSLRESHGLRDLTVSPATLWRGQSPVIPRLAERVAHH
jgi:hypothetical protein